MDITIRPLTMNELMNWRPVLHLLWIISGMLTVCAALKIVDYLWNSYS